MGAVDRPRRGGLAVSSLYAINGRAVYVPPGHSKVRGVIEATDWIWEPSTASWVEVRVYRPDYIGQMNDDLKAPVIRLNERF